MLLLLLLVFGAWTCLKVIDPYRKEVQVIHYTASAVEGQGNQILEEDVSITEPIELVVYKVNIPMWDVQEGIRRARSRKGKTDYKLFSNNCKSFVNWALTGEDVTDQGTTAPIKIGVGAAIGVEAVVFGVGALMGMFSSDDSKQKDKK